MRRGDGIYQRSRSRGGAQIVPIRNVIQCRWRSLRRTCRMPEGRDSIRWLSFLIAQCHLRSKWPDAPHMPGVTGSSPVSSTIADLDPEGTQSLRVYISLQDAL